MPAQQSTQQTIPAQPLSAQPLIQLPAVQKKHLIMVSILIVLVIIVFILDYLNKRSLILMIQNSSNAAMSSFAKMIILNLKYMWLPQVMSNLKMIRSLQVDTETIISFLCQFYAQTCNGHSITEYILRGYQSYQQQEEAAQQDGSNLAQQAAEEEDLYM